MRPPLGAAEQRSEVTRRLTDEFAGVLPPRTVQAEVESAEVELRGQVPPGSLDELLHRLAGHRLRERAGVAG